MAGKLRLGALWDKHKEESPSHGRLGKRLWLICCGSESRETHITQEPPQDAEVGQGIYSYRGWSQRGVFTLKVSPWRSFHYTAAIPNQWLKLTPIVISYALLWHLATEQYAVAYGCFCTQRPDGWQTGVFSEDISTTIIFTIHLPLHVH